MTWQILNDDCIDVLRTMEPASVDAIVTDPPYGLEFMGREWDRLGGGGSGRTRGAVHEPTLEARNDTPQHRSAVKQPSYLKRCAQCGGNSSGAWGRCACETPDFRERSDLKRAMQDWHEAWAREALRVLKPGGHLLAFGGTRTYHRLTCAIEDAGFEVRDCIAWMYGSGFPKSLDVGKAIDKAAGAEREVQEIVGGGVPPGAGNYGGGANQGERYRGVHWVDAPATPDAVRWDGWGTALKPAFEPIVVARKPLAGTVAGNVLAWGTGALNVDGCRVASSADDPNARANKSHKDRETHGYSGPWEPMEREWNAATGRWPANVVLDSEAAAVLDEQTGETSSTASMRGERSGAIYGNGAGPSGPDTLRGYDDAGGASRFFYVAKADSAERNAGLAVTTLFTPPDAPTRNDHPTVKPIALMRWLVRLVTPPGGLVLDPFAGSGTTGCATVLEGFNFVGIEREEASVEIARARIAHWSNGTTEHVA